jgi:hypothetical protein
LFERGVAPGDAPAADFETLPGGDLPGLLAIEDASKGPGPLRLNPEAARVERMRAALEAHGPAPYIAVTWRGGVKPVGPAQSQLKAVNPAALGNALRGHRASWVSVQRFPESGEREAMASALGAPVLDMSSANADLEDMLALLSLVEGYVGVSNANTYLAGGATKLKVLIPHPPEWRWGLTEKSAWFPEASLYRQGRDGDWSQAFARLASELKD